MRNPRVPDGVPSVGVRSHAVHSTTTMENGKNQAALLSRNSSDPLHDHQDHRDGKEEVVEPVVKAEEYPADEPGREDEEPEDAEDAEAVEHEHLPPALQGVRASGNAASRVPTLG